MAKYTGIPQSSGSEPNRRQTLPAKGDFVVRGTPCRRKAVYVGVPLFSCLLLLVVATFAIFNNNDDVERSKPPLRFVLIPLAGFGNKLRSIAKLYGFAESLGPSARKREMYVNWDLPGDILWNDVFSTPTQEEWGYKEVKYGLTTANMKGGPAPDIGSLCLWAGWDDGWAFRKVEKYGFNVSDATILGVGIARDGIAYGSITYDSVTDCDTVVLASAWGFANTGRGQYYESRLLRELDISEPVRPRLQALQTKMASTAKVLGVHLRETDIPKTSRVDLGQAMTILRRVMVKEPNSTKIYVSSDTHEGFSLVQRAYPTRVISQVNATRDRSSIDGLRCAAIDLLLLAFCDEVICTSHESTFSQMAIEIHHAKGGGAESVEYFDELLPLSGPSRKKWLFFGCGAIAVGALVGICVVCNSR